MATIDDVYNLLNTQLGIGALTLRSTLDDYGTLSGEVSAASNDAHRANQALGWGFGENATHTVDTDLAAIKATLADMETALAALSVDVANVHNAINLLDLTPLDNLGTGTDSQLAGQDTLFGVINDIFLIPPGP